MSSARHLRAGLSRRDSLRLALLTGLAAGVALSGCGGGASASATAAPGAVAGSTSTGTVASRAASTAAASTSNTTTSSATGAASAVTQTTAVTATTATPATAAATTVAKATGQVLFMSRGDTTQQQLDERALQALKKEQPGIDVQLVMASDYEKQITALVAGGEPPSVGFGLISTNVLHYVNGVTVDLAPYFARDSTLHVSDYDPYWIGAFQWHGHLVAIPRDPAMVVLYFNPAVFRGAGQAMPGTAEADRLSWERVIQEATPMTRTATGSPLGGNAAAWPEVAQEGLEWSIFGHEWWMISRQQGLEPFDQTYTHIDEQAAVAGLSFLHDTMWKQTVTVPPNVKTKQPIGFEQGNVGMKAYGNWDVQTWRQKLQSPWDEAPLPNFQGKPPAGLGWGSGMELFNHIKDAEAAWQLYRFLVGPEGSLIYIQGGLGQPILKQLANTPAFLDVKPPEHPDVALKETAYAKPPVMSYPGYNDVKAIFGKAQTAVYQNQQTPSEAMAAVTPAINAKLAEWAKRLSSGAV
jgi:multiple sugar transport system substrate-binding protein